MPLFFVLIFSYTTSKLFFNGCHSLLVLAIAFRSVEDLHWSVQPRFEPGRNPYSCLTRHQLKYAATQATPHTQRATQHPQLRRVRPLLLFWLFLFCLASFLFSSFRLSFVCTQISLSNSCFQLRTDRISTGAIPLIN
jgi:hypothetical protein